MRKRKPVLKTEFDKKEEGLRGFQFQSTLDKALSFEENITVENKDLENRFKNYRKEMFPIDPNKVPIIGRNLNVYQKEMMNMSFKEFVLKINQIKRKEKDVMSKSERDTLKNIYFLIKPIIKKKEEKQ